VIRNANVLGTFRNAGVANGVTAVSAADFQRGNFRNTVAVDRATLQQASLVRGTVPMTPTSQNLRFTNRAASITTPRTNAGAAGQRFFGSSNASPARTPFAQQQNAMRSAVNGTSQVRTATQGREGSQPAGAYRGGGAGQSSAAGWQRFEGTPGNARSATPGAAANRMNSTPNSGNSSPRPFQVSPSIIRQRPEVTYGSGTQQQARPQQAPAQQSYGNNGAEARPQQQAPAQGSGGGSAPRSAPAGGGSRGSGSRGSGRH